ncbi:MAG TPA: hypothetical protein VFX17_00760 [Patescibacteria group bacterium]|nr:hypothetical protein [Patescibacteria group bacterium]
MDIEFVREAYRNNPGVFLDFRTPDGKKITEVRITPKQLPKGHAT